MRTRKNLYWIAAISLVISGQALAMGSSPANPAEEPKPAEQKKQAADAAVKAAPRAGAEEIKKIFQDATNALGEIDQMIAQRKFGDARAKSRAMLLDIRSRSGIESRTPRLIELSETMSLADMKVPFEDLPELTQVKISTAVKQLEQGYFLELLNLAKRIEVLYLRSSYLQMKDKGALAERDISYIKSELKSIHAIQLLVKPKGRNELYLAFDSEVVDETVQYEFNRELLDFALEIKELRYTEKSFESELEAFRNAIFKKNVDALPKEEKVVVSTLGLSTGDFIIGRVENLSNSAKLFNIFVKYEGYLSYINVNMSFQGTRFIDAICASHGYQKAIRVNGVDRDKDTAVVTIKGINHDGYTYWHAQSGGTAIEFIECAK